MIAVEVSSRAGEDGAKVTRRTGVLVKHLLQREAPGALVHQEIQIVGERAMRTALEIDQYYIGFAVSVDIGGIGRKVVIAANVFRDLLQRVVPGVVAGRVIQGSCIGRV